MTLGRYAAALCLLLMMAAGARADVAVPPVASGPVVDLTGTLSGAATARLESKLRAFAASKGSQLAVIMVPTTQPEEIEQFSIRVEDAWKLGRKGVDDGVYFVVAKDDRRVRIEVGYGLEGALNDATANRIIQEIVTPRFKANDYDGGIEAGVDQIIAVVNGEPLPEPDRKWERNGAGLGQMLPVLFVIVLIAGGVLRAIFGRLFGSVAAGGIAGFVAWAMSHWLLVGVGAGFFAFLFALLAGGAGGGWTGGRGGRGGWGGFGGGLGGGFGGGGFGGGGGGGASGSW